MQKFYTKKSIALALAVVAASGALSAKTVYIVQDGVRYYWNNTKSYVEVTSPEKGSVYVGDIVIPSSVTYGEKELAVTGVRSSAFSECTYLNSVTLPESVTSIGDYAFDSCEEITKVEMPGVKTIGHWSFRNCYKLEALNFSDQLQTIGNYCFDKNLQVTSVTLPASVTQIGGYAFEGNPQLATVICYATTPPAVKKGYLDGEEIYTIFDDSDYGDRVLYVPAGTVNTYKSALGWHHFSSNIKEIGSDGIEAVVSSSALFAVKAVGGNSVEVTADKSAQVRVVNVNGQLVKSLTVGAGTTTIDNLPSGLLIVNGVKVVVRP